MKVKGLRFGPNVRKLHRGKFLVVEHPKYGNYAMKWPRPRGKPTNPNVIATTSVFSRVAGMHRTSTAYDLAAAHKVTEGSPYIWIDFIKACAYGLGVEARLKNGQAVRGVRSLTRTIDAMLDSITDTVGSVLWRARSGWQGTPQGAQGEVLSVLDASGAVGWAKPTGGGGGASPFAEAPNAPDLTSYEIVSTRSTSTATRTARGTWLDIPSNADQDQVAALMALPTPPYKVTLGAILPMRVTQNGGFGIAVFDTSKSKNALFSYSARNDSYARLDYTLQSSLGRYANDTTVASSSTYPQPSGSYITMALSDDGTNFTWSLSFDGEHFIDMQTISRTDYVVPAYIGPSLIIFTPLASGKDIGFHVMNWKQESLT